MSTETELIIDRRRLRRKLTVWRIAAVVLALAALVALLWTPEAIEKYEDHVARIRITGLITGDQQTLDLVAAAAASKRVKAILLRIDSPGGTTSGSEALFGALRKAANDKPIVAVMDTVAASGGYITAIAADHIVARGNTITGSIGVIFTFPEVSRLLDTLGIRVEEIKSGELKAEPSPYKPVSDKVRAVSDEMVQDAFAWFIGLVAERRQIPLDQVKVLADGRVYTGRQAVANHLVDELGGEDEAIAWLEKNKNLAPGTRIVDWALPVNTDPTGLGFSIANTVLRAVGLGGLQDRAARANLDGLLVLWHPEL
jgi:protease-4